MRINTQLVSDNDKDDFDVERRFELITKIIDDINWQIESNIENINDDDDNGGCRDDSSKTVDDTIIDNKHEQNDIHNDKMDFDEKMRKAMAKIHEANVRKVTKKKLLLMLMFFFFSSKYILWLI